MSTFIFNTGADGMPLTRPAAETLTNVAYGKDPMQSMDIFLPADRSAEKTKSLILLHGGGWNSGSRHSLASQIDSFKRRMPGYAIFNIDYRLVKTNTPFSTQENDVKAAVDFITAHAGTYKINPGSFVLLGVSAGAHLALLQAYKNTAPKIAAVIDFFGPTDLTGMYNKPWNPMIPYLLESLIGGTPQTNTAAYYNASAINFIDVSTPPTLVFHGKRDNIVNLSQSQLLYQKLQQAGVPAKMVLYDAGHGWYGDILADSFDKIKSFLEKYLP